MFGAPSSSPFGAPAPAFGQPAPAPAFGAPSTGGFGAPAPAFGQPAPAPAFGAPGKLYASGEKSRNLSIPLSNHLHFKLCSLYFWIMLHSISAPAFGA